MVLSASVESQYANFAIRFLSSCRWVLSVSFVHRIIWGIYFSFTFLYGFVYPAFPTFQKLCLVYIFNCVIWWLKKLSTVGYYYNLVHKPFRCWNWTTLGWLGPYHGCWCPGSFVARSSATRVLTTMQDYQQVLVFHEEVHVMHFNYMCQLSAEKWENII